jgi:hypothetical protein
MGEKMSSYTVLVRETEGKNYEEDQEVVVKIILKWILEESARDVNWIHLADNGDEWRGFAKKATNIWAA